MGPCRRAAGLVVLLAGIAGGEALAQSAGGAPRAGEIAPLSPFLRQKAEALLRGQLSCLGCHALRGDGGTVGPDLGTVRERRSAEYVAAMIRDPEQVVPGSAMPRPMLAPETLDLITRYLAADDVRARGRPANAGSATAARRARDASTATADTGAAGRGAPIAAPAGGADRSAPALYARYCAACHGASGRGDGPNAARLPVPPANHASRAAMSARPDDSLFDTISGGGAIMGRSPRMPAYGATLTRAEIRSLVRHIRTLCKCEGPAWSRDGALKRRRTRSRQRRDEQRGEQHGEQRYE